MILSIFGISTVSNVLNSMAPRPANPCLAVEWYDEDNCSAPCEQCESCTAFAKHFHTHQCIAGKIPPSSEASRLTRASVEIQRAKEDRVNSTPGAIADAIAVIKDEYGIEDRVFKYNNLPFPHEIEIEWCRLIFSLPEFVSALSAYLIASWNHALFNMYERDAKNDGQDQRELFIVASQTYQEMCALVKKIDDEVYWVIMNVSSTKILPKASCKYKKLLKAYGLGFVCEGNNDEKADNEEISLLKAKIAQQLVILDNLQNQHLEMKHAYEVESFDNEDVIKADNALALKIMQEQDKLCDLKIQLKALKGKR